MPLDDKKIEENINWMKSQLSAGSAGSSITCNSALYGALLINLNHKINICKAKKKFNMARSYCQ